MRSKVACVAIGVLACGALSVRAQEAPVPASTNAPGRFFMSFHDMDANKDGKVTLDEYQAAMAASAKRRFEAMDTNKDGSVTEQEMNAARGGHRRPGAPGGPGRGGRREGQGGQPPAASGAR
jgi:hypothetical protein